MAGKSFRTSIYSTSINFEINALFPYVSVPASFGTLIDVGTDDYHTSFELYNGTNADITINFVEGSVEKVILAGVGISRYPFVHNGVIQYKYTSSAPTTGSVMISSW